MNNYKDPIGVFDSGVGGISVLSKLCSLMPNEDFIYLGDTKNAPYGTKTEEEIKAHSLSCTQKLIDMGAKAVVVACNTATSVSAKDLREKFSVPIIGIEPAIKPAVIGHKGEKILVMATPMTIKKEKFKHLLEDYADVSEIISLPCPGLADLIERGQIQGKQIRAYLDDLFSVIEKDEIKAIVLGCTHYPFIKDEIKTYFPNVQDIIDGGFGTAKETKRRLISEGLLNTKCDTGKITFISSRGDKADTELMEKMMKLSQ